MSREVKVGREGADRRSGGKLSFIVVSPVSDDGWPSSVVAAGLEALGHDVCGVRVGGDLVAECEKLKAWERLRVADVVILALPVDARLAILWIGTVLPALDATVVVVDPAADVQRELQAFRGGAADYVTTAHDLLILEARLGRHCAPGRRAGRRVPSSGVHTAVTARPANELTLGPLAIEPNGRWATCRGASIELTPNERAILLALMQARGGVVPVADLAALTRSPSRPRAVDDVRTYVRRIRRKLHGDADLVETAPGGYRLRGVR